MDKHQHIMEQRNNSYFCKICTRDSKSLEIEEMKENPKGICYAYEKDNMIGGFADRLYPAYYGNEWRSIFGDKRQVVQWNVDGQAYSGIYFKTNSDIIRWRKVKS